MTKPFAYFIIVVTMVGSTYISCYSTAVPKEILPAGCEDGAVLTRSLPEEASAEKNKVESSLTTDPVQTTGASMKLVKGGDDEEEDEKDDAKDKDDESERLWDSVTLG